MKSTEYTSHTELFVHLVWGTWDRLSLVTPELEPKIYAAIAEKCREMRCTPVKIGGVADHIHMLVRIHPTVAVSDLVKNLKGVSSHLVTHVLAPDTFFKWQGSYGAFSVSAEIIPRLLVYIENQKNHHETGEVNTVWEGIE